MAKYVILLNWTDQGIKTATDSVQRADQARQLAESLGGHVDLLLWTVGRYDIVGVFDMPNDEALTTLALKVGAAGAVRTESLRAFTAEELGGILANLS